MAHIFNCIGDVDGQSSFGLLSKSHTPEPLSPRLPDPASPNTNSNDTNRPPSPAQTVARRLLTTIQKHQTPQQQQQQKQDSWLNLDTPTNMATPQPSSASAQQQQQQQQPKRFQYQLFPKQTPTANIAPRGPDIDKALAAAGAAAAAATVEKDDQAAKFAPTASLKTKISQHSLVRRRKVSVPDLGPMTTVHEVPMDSRAYTQLPLLKTHTD